MKKFLFYAETGRGCCIRSGHDINVVFEDLEKEVGSIDGVQEIRYATENDLTYVKGMMGIIPEGEIYVR